MNFSDIFNNNKGRKNLRSRKEFYSSFIGIGIPLMIQTLLSSSLNLVDNLMIGQLGAQYIAGLGFSNSVYKVLDLFLFGGFSGMGVFIAQYHGKKDYAVIKKILGVMIIIGVVISLSFTLISNIFSNLIISFYTVDESVAKIGVSYLKLSALSYLPSALAFALSFALRSIGNTKVPMISSGIGILSNTILNYLLIYGKFGFPRLLERGAAIATIIARILQLLITFYLIYRNSYGLRGKIKEYLGVSRALIYEMKKVSLPIFFTEVFWILGSTLLMIAYSRLGTNEAASVQLTDVFGSIAAIIFMGVSNATSVIIGKSIGEGKKMKAVLHSKRSVKLALICSMSVFILLQILAGPLVSLYKFEPEVARLATLTVRVFSAALIFKLVNWTILIGVLRAGGDTKVAFYLDTIPMYLIAVPLAFLSLYLKLPVYIAVALVNIEEVVKFYLSFRRYFSLRWLKDITV